MHCTQTTTWGEKHTHTYLWAMSVSFRSWWW